MSAGLRVAVVGATGALGGEVLAVLSESALAVAELLPLATDRSLGNDVEFQGERVPVETGEPELRGFDLVFLCAPPDASLAFARRALRAEAACVDAAGALAASPEVPLGVAALGLPAGDAPTPLVAVPPPTSLALALVLAPLAREAGLRRVLASVLSTAAAGGRQGIDALYRESVALFAQQDLPEPEAFARPIAFDCLPEVGEAQSDGATQAEAAAVGALARLLGRDLRAALQMVQVPAFAGLGITLALESERPLDPKRAAELLGGAPGVELCEEAPTLRAGAGRDVVLVGRLRRDPSCERGLLAWLATDGLRLAAGNAVALAAARLARLH